jgi:hypothetical protein
MQRVTLPTDKTFIDMAFMGAWRIRTRGGEYLDVAPEGESGHWVLTSQPVSGLRHAFRFRSFEKVDARHWGVWAEPVPLHESLDPVESAQAPGGYIFPFVLAYDGCNRFVLEDLPESHPLRSLGTLAARKNLNTVARFAADAANGLPVEIDAFSFLNTFSGINFPSFTGDEQRAFTAIGAMLGFDPHSSLLTLAALSNVQKPADIPQVAWDAVIVQLRIEIDYRELVRNYFMRVESFVQNVFISNAGLVDNVGALVGLDANNIVQLLLNSAMQAMAGAVGGLGFPGAGVVSGALKVLFEQLAKDKGPSAGDFSVALSQARSRMSELFDALITAVQNWRAEVFNDWGKLKTMGVNLKSGQVAWPDSDEEMRKAARKQLEISLFKDLLKVRWNHMRASNDPSFHTTQDWINGYMQKNRNYWVVAVPYTQKDLFGKETKGYQVTMHWLGRGSTIFDHKQPDDRMSNRIFDDLGVPRSTVFNEWGMAPQIFFVNNGRGF